MKILLQIIIYSALSGFAILIGAFFANFFNIKKAQEKIVRGVTAFGGGVLISAVAFALTPKAIEILSTHLLIVIFIIGTLFFLLVDMYITSRAGSFAQVMAMMLDFIPEAIALGAAFAHHIHFGMLLAFFIGLQNLPEGFNSYEEMIEKGYKAKEIFVILIPISLLGVLSAIFGFLFLSESPKTVAGIMLFAGGGIIYLMFQHIAPLSRVRKSWTPALGASLGFLFGMVGEKLLIG